MKPDLSQDGSRGRLRAHPSDRAAGLRPQSLRLFAEQHPLRAALADVLRLWLPPIVTLAILFLFVFAIPAIFGGM